MAGYVWSGFKLDGTVRFVVRLRTREHSRLLVFDEYLKISVQMWGSGVGSVLEPTFNLISKCW